MTIKGRSHSAETRAKISAALKRRPISLEHRAKISATLKGRILPEDAPQRKKGRSLSESTKEKLRNYKHTEEARARISAGLRCREVSKETRAKIASKLLGHAVSEETRNKIAEKVRPIASFSFRGGQTAEDFAAILCPAGFIREHHILWGKRNERFILDFAHIDGMVNIELDGESHNYTQKQDAVRDEFLKILGWRVIRIKI